LTSSSTFRGYCRTSILPAGRDVGEALEWKRRYFRAHYQRFLPNDLSAAIADVGCGFGPYLATLRDLGYRNLLGVDLGEDQVAVARDVLGLPVELGEAATWLESHPAQFDCILMFDLLEHLEAPDLVRTAQAAGQALRPGGRLIVQVPNGMAPINSILHGDITHKRGFNVQSLRQVLAIAQLEPKAFVELAPHPHSLRSAVQRCAYLLLVKPLLRTLVLIAQGAVEGHIYTVNVAVVGERADG